MLRLLLGLGLSIASLATHAIVRGHGSIPFIYESNAAHVYSTDYDANYFPDGNGWDLVDYYYGNGYEWDVPYGCNATRISKDWYITSAVCARGFDNRKQNPSVF